MYQGRIDRNVLVDELSGMPPGYLPVQLDGMNTPSKLVVL